MCRNVLFCYFDQFEQTGSDLMKIERINDNQIRCTLSNFDLSMRNLNVNELTYGSEKARLLFREMIQRASNEVGFEAEDIPLMVEAIPMSNESIVLIITKIEDPEELDTRFSKFTPANEDEEAPWNGLPTEILDGAEALLELLGNPDFINDLTSGDKADKKIAKSEDPLDQPKEEDAKDPLSYIRLYQFDSLDLVCAAAKETGKLFTGASVLYKNPSSGKFYLILKKAGSDEITFSRICNILSEYGYRQKYDTALEAYFDEHYELFVKKDVLKVLSVI